jgi:hypothetical protein
MAIVNYPTINMGYIFMLLEVHRELNILIRSSGPRKRKMSGTGIKTFLFFW